MATTGDGLEHCAATESSATVRTSAGNATAIKVDKMPIDMRFLTAEDVEKRRALAALPQFVIDGIADHMRHEKVFGAQLMPLYCPTHNTWVAEEIQNFRSDY